MTIVIKLSVIVMVLVALSVYGKTVDAQNKRVVCYFGSWSVYRPGMGKYDVEDINPMLCTHLIFGFAGLEWDGSGRIMVLDKFNEEEDEWGSGRGAFRRFTNLKLENPNLKTILAIGGWNEGTDKYSRMASSPQTRQVFLDSVVALLEKYNFDGLDLDWEYPAACTVNCGRPEDKQNFAILCREVRAEFDRRGWLLTAAVSAGEFTIADAYDIPSISNSLHFINVMTYDFHGGWEKHTGHHSPLSPHPEEVGNNTKLNTKHAIEYWIANGAPPSKLNLGLGSYGRGFILDDPQNYGVYANASKPIPAGPYTRENGFWGFNEICERFRSEEWYGVRDAYYQTPYAFRGDLWIGYDDVQSIEEKSKWALERGLGGVFIWSVETDDFHGLCGEPNPLIKTMWRTVNGEIPPRPTPDPNLPTTTGRPTPPPEAGQCTTVGQQLGIKCDDYFFVCTRNGDSWTHVLNNCQPGLRYDPVSKNCNWPDVIGCA